MRTLTIAGELMVNFFSRKLGIGLTSGDLYGKPKPKKFNYSSDANSMIIETAISDYASVTESTSSAVIEDTLIDKFIPKNDHARYYVCGILLGKKNILGTTKWEKYGVREALTEIFANESIGTDWKSAHQGAGEEIVEFAYELLLKHDDTFQDQLFDNDFSRIYDCRNSWDSVCGVLEVAAHEETNSSLSFAYTEEAKCGRQMEEAMEHDRSFRLSNTFRFLIQNWTTLGSWTHAWRFMTAVMDSIRDWNDTPEERIEFRKVCESVFSIWDASDEAKKNEDKKKKEDSMLTIYDMKDGAFVKAPRSWIVTNPESAINSDYAGVIEIRNGEKYDAPHFLFFLADHTASELTDEERFSIIRDATSKWPPFVQVQEDVVELKYGPDGGIINQKEYMQAPTIGFFPIFDEGKYPLGNPPYGAVVVRNRKEE